MKEMTRLQRAMLVIAAGSILPTASLAHAQATVSGPGAASPTSSLPSSGSSGTEKQSAGDGKPGVGNSANSGAGYTWHDKRSHSRHKKASQAKINPNLAQAKGPEFEVVADGTTRITVQLSKKVEFRTETHRGRFIVNLEHAQVAVLNDRNPLITTHFATPVQDARLVSTKDAVRVVIDLREPVSPQVMLKDAAAGSSVLEIVLPKSSHKRPGSSESTGAKPRPKSRTKTTSTK